MKKGMMIFRHKIRVYVSRLNLSKRQKLGLFNSPYDRKRRFYVKPPFFPSLCAKASAYVIAGTEVHDCIAVRY